MLLKYFTEQSARSGRVAQDARALLGPQGEINTVNQSALDDIKAAGNVTEAAERKRGKGQAALAHDRAFKLEIQDRGDQERLKKRATMVREYQSRADILSEQAQNAEVKDFWADKSTGSRILGILAQTLSGAANGLAGNPSAPSPLDRIIDRDLEVQRANLQNKRLGADRAQNALAQVYNGFQQEDASISAYRQAATQWYMAKANELDAQFGTDTSHAKNLMIQAQGKQAIAKFQADQARHGAEAAEAEHRASDDNRVQLARDESNEYQADVARQDQGVEVPGVNGPVRKGVANSQWSKISQGFGGAFANLDHLQRLINKPGFNLADKLGADASAALLKGDARAILGTGANLSAEESKDLSSLIVSYLKQKGVKSIGELGAPDTNELVGAIRLSLARTWQSRVRSTFAGRDIARNSGFESAYDAIAADEAASTQEAK